MENIKVRTGKFFNKAKSNKSSKNKMKNIKKELKVKAKTQATIEKMRNTVKKG